MLVFVLLSWLCLNKAQVPPSNGTFSLNFLFSSTGSTSNNEFSWDITNNIGSMTIRGTKYKSFAYYTQKWPGELRWIDIIGISNDGSNLAIVYLDFEYWNNIIVTPYWEEDFYTTLQSYTIDRNGIPCNFNDLSGNNSLIQVSFPQLLNPIPNNIINSNFIISGKDIMFNKNIGWQLYNNYNYTIYPISIVDCYDCPPNCPECLPGPWFEIHHSAVTQDNKNVCFGIYYIYPSDTSFVQWNYTFCLPQITSPNITYDATWKIEE